jgi:haloalkane dehalogenase
MTASPRETVPVWLDREGYPFTNRFLALPTGRLHYVDEGRGPAVLFVHGTPTWSYEWRHLIAALTPGWRCVAPDLLGFGLSDRPCDFPYTPEAHAAILAEFVARLGSTTSRWSFTTTEARSGCRSAWTSPPASAGSCS